MANAVEQMRRIVRFAGEVAAETLWPSRCVLCDRPGDVLCSACARTLHYVDWWRACRRCGAPFGLVQCDVCNPVGLGRIGCAELPFAACASAVLFDDDTGRLVRAFKDQGERRLSEVLIDAMARAVPPDWVFDAVTFVPATLAAVRFRGFDHAELIASGLARELGAPCVGTLARPRTRDQRALTAEQRIANLAGRFSAFDRVQPARLLLVDDVFTTGSTICAATDALLKAGVQEVRALTFARV